MHDEKSSLVHRFLENNTDFLLFACPLLICFLLGIELICLSIWNGKVWSEKRTLACVQALLARMWRKTYGHQVPMPPLRGPLYTSQRFMETLVWGCCDNGTICLHSWCCNVCRTVDTLVTVGIVQRNQAILHALSIAAFQCVCLPCYLFAIKPLMRAKVRAVLGGDEITGWDDFAASVCCPLCSAQRLRKHAKQIKQ